MAVAPARTRKLVHWLNSLPLASCLLVESLEELRLGDALAAVVRWLEDADPDNDEDEDGSARGRVARVVEFVARRVGTMDGDALYVVNGAQCVARLAAGDVAAIAAVVEVLRRLASEKEAAVWAAAVQHAQLVRQCVSRAIEERSLAGGAMEEEEETNRDEEENARVVSTKSRAQRSSSRSVGHRLSTRTAPRGSPPRPKTSTGAPTAACAGLIRPHSSHKENEMQPGKTRVGVAKTVLQHKSTRSGIGTPRKRTPASDALADEVLRWMDASLGGSLWSDKTSTPRSRLQDGVALCALAAVVARRRGSITIRHKLQTTTAPGGARGLFPRGATTQPRTRAERRHNLATAWTLLKECHVLPASVAELTADQVAELVEEEPTTAKEDGSVSIWSVLAHVQSQLTQTRPARSARQAATASSAPIADEEDGDSAVAPRRRPYVTTEQIDVVKRWMKTTGVDPAAVSSGILDDCLRNGVALCLVLCKTQLARLNFKDPPKTLLEVRSNIHAAIAVLVGLGESRIPTVYLTRQAVEGIAMGDKQYSFGLLWHVMQFCKDRDARTTQSKPPAAIESVPGEVAVDAPESPQPPPPPRAAPPKQSKPLSIESRPTKPRITSLALDVPACQLVDEELRGSDAIPTVVGCHSVPWEATSLLDGLDDIDPPVKAKRMALTELEEPPEDDIVPLHPSEQSRQSNDDLDLVPRQTVQQSRIQVERETKPVIEVQQTPATVAVSENVDTPAPQPHPSSAIVSAGDANDAASPPPPPPAEYNTAQLRQWLQRLGIELVDVHAFHNPGENLREFSSGVLLCSLVEKLEHMRSMEGVCRPESTGTGIARAHALHNIDKALDVLRSKKTLPISLLRRRLQIYDGDRVAVLNLLIHVRKAYGHHRRALQPRKTDGGAASEPKRPMSVGANVMSHHIR